MLGPRWFFPLCLWAAGVCLLGAEELFSVGFESSGGFSAGSDEIAGKNNWLGTTSAGTDRSGIDTEEQHGVAGLGNAGWIGGNTLPVTWAGSSINLRRPLNAAAPFYNDPAAAGTEVVFITALIGIKDSSDETTPVRRDNFELFIMNGASTAAGSGDVLAAIQFDNASLTDGIPQQLVRRTQSSAGTKALTYVSTEANFLHDTMQSLTVRINFRTNLWTAALDGLPLFVDEPFYNGSAAVNLGAVGFRMIFGSVTPQTTSYTCTGGDNYMLFDDLTLQANPPADPGLQVKPEAAGASLIWNVETGYRYQVLGSTTLHDWSPLFSGFLTADKTGTQSFSDATAAGQSAKFYKVSRSTP
ncbi:MAG: hypothetical protein V4726_04615 [Verrucomicrobiota bacterium]